MTVMPISTIFLKQIYHTSRFHCIQLSNSHLKHMVVMKKGTSLGLPLYMHVDFESLFRYTVPIGAVDTHRPNPKSSMAEMSQLASGGSQTQRKYYPDQDARK
jgi:hypothetical protein